MASFPLTLDLVYSLLSDVDEYQSTRFTRRETDPVSGNSYYVTIFTTTGLKVASGVHYIISVSPVTPYVQDLSTQIVFYQVYQSPPGTEMMFTQITEATAISFSVSKSLLYLFYKNRSYPLLFQLPYTNVKECKQAILNLFTFPSTIFMLYGNVFIQYTYIDVAYHAAFMGSFDSNKETMVIRNLLDYNKTFVMLEEGNPVLYWNSQDFAVGNQVPYISYTPSMSLSSPIQTTIVTGFVNNYIVQTTTDGDIRRFATTSRNDSVNINQDISAGIGYTVLARAIPLMVPPLPVQDYSRFYMTGFGGLGYKDNQSLFAAIQILNILNSNSVYVTQSAPVVTTPIRMGLTKYNDLFYYNFDQINFILTVWVSPNPMVPSFYAYLAQSAGTIMTSDLTQLTDNEITGITDIGMGAGGVNAYTFTNNTNQIITVSLYNTLENMRNKSTPLASATLSAGGRNIFSSTLPSTVYVQLTGSDGQIIVFDTDSKLTQPGMYTIMSFPTTSSGPPCTTSTVQSCTPVSQCTTTTTNVYSLQTIGQKTKGYTFTNNTNQTITVSLYDSLENMKNKSTPLASATLSANGRNNFSPFLPSTVFVDFTNINGQSLTNTVSQPLSQQGTYNITSSASTTSGPPCTTVQNCTPVTNKQCTTTTTYSYSIKSQMGK